MELLIVRHGPAEPLGPSYPDDDKRPLTAVGADRLAAAAPAFPVLFPDPSALWTSPALRARVTGQEIAKGYRQLLPEARTELAPGTDAPSVHAWLAHLPAAERRIVVGHQPVVSQLVGLYATGQPRAVVQQEPGSAVALGFRSELRPGRGLVLWALPLETLAEMGTRYAARSGAARRKDGGASRKVANTEGKRGRSTTTATRP